MKKASRFGLVLLICVSISLAGCKKNTDSGSTPETTTDQLQMSADENFQHTETQNSMNEANDAIAGSGFGKTPVIWGAIISTDSILKKVSISYSGNNKDGSRYRSGGIIVQLSKGLRWRDKDAEITITYNNFKVTDNKTQKNMTFGGTIVVTNATGGIAFTDANVVHLATSSSFTITFDDSLNRTWNLSRKRTFSTSSGDYFVKEEGTGSSGSYNNLVAWGKNRKGSDFYTQISVPIVYSTINSNTCPRTIMSGEKNHIIVGGTALRLIFGLDANGGAVTSGCPAAYGVNWTNSKGEPRAVIVKY